MATKDSVELGELPGVGGRRSDDGAKKTGPSNRLETGVLRLSPAVVVVVVGGGGGGADGGDAGVEWRWLLAPAAAAADDDDEDNEDGAFLGVSSVGVVNATVPPPPPSSSSSSVGSSDLKASKLMRLKLQAPVSANNPSMIMVVGRRFFFLAPPRASRSQPAKASVGSTIDAIQRAVTPGGKKQPNTHTHTHTHTHARARDYGHTHTHLDDSPRNKLAASTLNQQVTHSH